MQFPGEHGPELLQAKGMARCGGSIRTGRLQAATDEKGAATAPFLNNNPNARQALAAATARLAITATRLAR